MENGEKRHPLWGRIKRKARYWYLRVVRLRATPHNIALGVALGIFIGFMPIIPFQSVVVITLALIFRASKLAAWLATFISNPLDMIPLYYLLFRVGDTVMPFEGLRFDPSDLTMEGLLHTGAKVFAVMVAGGLVMGFPASIASYFVSKWIVKRYRARRALRQLRKRTQL
ncbi:MAG: DUF2062 domain-containing protein [Desulfovibrionaceae bacterium]